MSRRVWVGVLGLVGVSIVAVRHCATDTQRSADHPALHPSGLRVIAGRKVPIGRASIDGAVTDHAKHAVAFALVCAEAEDAPRCTAADAAGHYSIADLGAATYSVTAVAPRHAPSTPIEVKLALDEHRTIDAELTDGGVEVTGTVTDVRGGAVAHARVCAWSLARMARSPSVETDGDGHFDLWTWDGATTILASADGYLDNSATVVPTTPVSIALVPSASIEGIVVDAATKQPVAGAKVSQGRMSLGATTTDEQGHFRIDGIDGGRYSLVASADHRYGLSSGDVGVERGKHVDQITIEVSPVAELAVHLMLADAPGQPCPGARLWLYRADFESFAPDSTGLAKVAVAPGNYRLSVGCAGYRADDEADKQIEMTTSDVSVTFTFRRGATIHGIVHDATGAPIAAATVSASRNGRSGDARTKRDGSYEIDGLGPGDYKLSVFSEAGVLHSQPIVTVLDTGSAAQDLVLDGGATVIGTVVDGAGTPQRDVRVYLVSASHQTTTDASGQFRIDHVATGHDDVGADIAPAKTHYESIEIKGNETVTVRLVVDTVTAPIHGTVLDPGGAPVFGATIAVSPDGEEYNIRTLESAPDGTFATKPLPAGSYRVKAESSVYEAAVVEHVAPSSAVALRFKATASVSGIVRDSTGAPATDFWVDVDTNDGPALAVRFFGGGGRYTISGVPTGAVEVHAHTKLQDGAVGVVIHPGDHLSTVEIATNSAASVVGRVVDAVTGLPIADAYVQALFATGGYGHGARHDTTSDHDGRFVLHDVATGPVEISIYKDDYRVQRIKRDASALLDTGDVALDKPR